MNKIKYLLVILPITFYLSSCAPQQDEDNSLKLERLENRQPMNIVFVFSDDHSYKNMGFMGHDFVETPNMDAMAANGVYMSNAIVTTSLCSPSRASIHTGQYAFTHGVIDNNSPDPEGATYFSEYLQEAGYNTAFIGKWHMGAHTDDPRPGWEHWVSFQGQGRYPHQGQRLNVNGKHVDRTDYITDELTDYAVDWLETQKESDTPFMLYLSHKGVHSNFQPAERHLDKYADEQVVWPETMFLDDEQMAEKPMWLKDQRNSWHGVDYPYHSNLDLDHWYKRYNETILSVDESIGSVIDYLKKNDMYENTVIIYSSDQGFHFGEQGLIDKRVAYEPSIRIPLLLEAPKIFNAGTTVNQVVANIDIAPTILDIAGLKAPETMQGRSFLSLAKQEDVENWDRDYMLYTYYWEEKFPQTPTILALRGDRYKYIHYYGLWDTHELYDLLEDPDEKHNIIRRDVESWEIASDLRSKLFTMLEEKGAGAIPLREPRDDNPLRNARRSKEGAVEADFPYYYFEPIRNR
ncbi:MAG: sulfatase [Balneolales bacterium]